MPRIHIRCLLIVAVCQLLLGPSSSPAQDWDPISAGVGGGSLVGSIAYQPPSGKNSGIHAGACNPGAVGVKAFKGELQGACTRRLYVPRGRRCAECRPKDNLDVKARGTSDEWTPTDDGEWVVKDSKNPNAFELEFGQIQFDDAPAEGFDEDVFFVSAGYRRALLAAGKRDSFRLIAGVGLGVYDLDPDRERSRQAGEKLGFHAKLVAEIGLNPKAKEPPTTTYVTLELAVVHHRLDTGLDTTGGMVGIRFHFPGD